jgi:hypothetical protein
MFYPSICWGLRVFEGFVVFEISTGSSFGRSGAWQAGSDVTIWFLDPTFVLVVCWHLLSVFFRSKIIQHFRLGLKFPQGSKFWGFLGILDPLMHAYINETPKWHVLASNRVVWAITYVCATLVRPLRDSDEKIKKIKKIKWKKNY